MKAYDVVVVGLGHAGIEAAAAAARLGASVLAVSLTEEGIGLLPCNPAMGGPAKGHLLREVDALGGVAGVLTDAARIQIRRLNTGKGLAVQALRAQVDKDLYPELARAFVYGLPGVTVALAEVVDVRVRGGRVVGALFADGREVEAERVVVTAGVYLRGSVVRGEERRPEGPQGLPNAGALSRNLRRLGLRFLRFKTGTSPRVLGESVRFEAMRVQEGDAGELAFSFLNVPSAPAASRPRGVFSAESRPNVPTYVTYSEAGARELVLRNLHRAPLFTGEIEGVGPRYCPSFEDKVVRFREKERHPVFLEPETLSGPTWYLGGLSTSLPRDVQEELVRSIPGLEAAEIVRFGYAIEYDALDPTELLPTLECRRVKGLYFAGSANGTSGYEEAAAQGLLAGANAALSLKGEEPLVLGRHEAYLGVLVDDLVFKGTAEPYRMLTARAEHRLRCRQDNADFRLTPKAIELGLADEARREAFLRRQELVEALLEVVQERTVGVGGPAQEKLRALGSVPVPAGTSVGEALKRSELKVADFAAVVGSWPADVAEEVEARIKYEGYIAKEEARLRRLLALEGRPIPSDFPYEDVPGLSHEAREKLARLRPATLGQASRIPGIRPSDVALLEVLLARHAAPR